MKTPILSICIVVLTVWLTPCVAQDSSSEIQDMTLDSLLNIKVSSAAKYEQTVRQAPASVSIITAEEIEYYGYRTLDEVLMHVPGFYVSYDRNYSYIGVRGFGRPTDYNNRILLLLNGHTLNENVYGSALVGSELAISLDFIERVEIVRGPGSALYGSSAMFAVINLITKKGNLIDGVKLTLDAGSYGLLQGSARVGKELKSGWDVSASILGGDVKGQDLYYREYDQLSTNHGVARGLDWDKPRGIVATLADGGLSVQGMFTSRTKGIPTGAFGTIFNDPSAQTLDERFFLESRYSTAINAKTNIMIRGYFDGYHYAGTYPYDTAPEHDLTNNLWLGSELQFIWDIETGDRFTLGGELKHNYSTQYRSWDANHTYFDLNYPFSVFSLYVQNELQINEMFSLTLGLRWDKTSGYPVTLSPRGAIVCYPFPAATLKLLYGEAFRAPNIYELHYEDPASRAKTNPYLKAERIKTLEVVWEHRITDVLFGTLSAYNYRVTDLIDQTIDPSDSMLVFENISVVQTRGLEFGLNARTSSGLQGSISHTYQFAEDVASHEAMTNSPAHITKLGLAYQASHHVNVSLQLVHESGRKTLYGTQTSPVLLINIGVLIRPRINTNEPLLDIVNHTKCSFLVRNLLNSSYETPGGLEHREPAISQDGRNYSLKLEYAF